MELLITLAVLGGIFTLGAIVLGFAELSVYLIAGLRAFPVKVENTYNNLVEDNKEFVEKLKQRKITKKEAREKAKAEKLAKKQQAILDAVKQEAEKVEVKIEEPATTEVAPVVVEPTNN